MLTKMFYNVQLTIPIVLCQIVWVPNCPVPNCLGAKLSVLYYWCQIVYFIMSLPNCFFLTLGAKLSGAKFCDTKLSGAKLSYNPIQLYRFMIKKGVE